METKGLIVEIQHALGMSQTELGELVGVNKRTIQRWQEGFSLLPEQAHRLATALRPVRPELAEQVLQLGRESARRTGAPVQFAATPEQIDQIVRAARDAGAGIRATLAAAFAKAEELELEIDQVVAGLEEREPPG
jgi:transcriptional regulator with XRE-family HTH domain